MSAFGLHHFQKNSARYGIIYWRYLEANETLKPLSVRSSVILLQIYVFELYPYPPLYKKIVDK